MIYRTIFLSVFTLILLNSCSKDTSGLSSCIEDEIETWEDEIMCESGGLVEEYKFQGELVYVFIDGSCGADFQYPVLSAECDTLGALAGFAGNTTINGVEFYDEAEFIQNVWEQ